MGLDARINFEVNGDFRLLAELAADFSRRFDSNTLHLGDDSVIGWTEEYSPITGDYVAVPPIAELRNGWRMWCKGYERGPWSEMRSALELLLQWQETGRIGTLWYYGDSIDREDCEPFTRGDLADLDTHYASGSWTYRERFPEWSIPANPQANQAEADQ